MPKPRYWVRPRYTPGSPGPISEEQAWRLVSEEKTAYTASMEGFYGPVLQEEARRLGLKGIVEEQRERLNGWDVHDLITDQKFYRTEIPAKKLKVGDVIRYMEQNQRPVETIPPDGIRVSELGATPGSVFMRHDPRVQFWTAIFRKEDRVVVERALT